jgi:hypothetical protein
MEIGEGVVSTDYSLSQLDHRIALLRDHLNELSRGAELLSGEEHRQKSAEIAKWTAELEELVFERRALSHDAS